MPIKCHYDIPNLVRELAENRISPLEIIREVHDEILAPEHRLYKELASLGILDSPGTAIWIENLGSDDRAELLSISS